jgi:hypothetical protein
MLLSFQTTTFPPAVVLTLAPESLNMVLESAPSNHNVHPAIEVGSKFHIFFDASATTPYWAMLINIAHTLFRQLTIPNKHY